MKLKYIVKLEEDVVLTYIHQICIYDTLQQNEHAGL